MACLSALTSQDTFWPCKTNSLELKPQARQTLGFSSISPNHSKSNRTVNKVGRVLPMTQSTISLLIKVLRNLEPRRHCPLKWFYIRGFDKEAYTRESSWRRAWLAVWVAVVYCAFWLGTHIRLGVFVWALAICQGCSRGYESQESER